MAVMVRLLCFPSDRSVIKCPLQTRLSWSVEDVKVDVNVVSHHTELLTSLSSSLHLHCGSLLS